MEKASIVLREIVAFQEILAKATRAHTRRDELYSRAEAHLQDILSRLSEADTIRELEELFSALQIATGQQLGTVLETLDVHAEEFAEKERDLQKLVTLSLADYTELIKIAKPVLSSDSFEEVTAAVPRNVAQFRSTFEKVGTEALRAARTSSQLPRHEKKRSKQTTLTHIWRTCVGSAMALGNVILALPRFGLVSTVAIPSMTVGATVMGVSVTGIVRSRGAVSTGKKANQTEKRAPHPRSTGSDKP